MNPFLNLDSDGLLKQSSEELLFDLGLVEKELACLLRSDIKLANEISWHTLHAGGKRLRPALVLMSARATGNAFDVKRAVRLAAVLEMIHMATLIHDDVIDCADMRRGRPTAAVSFGRVESILAGDIILAKAMRVLAEDGDIDIIRIVSKSVEEMAEGEVYELQTRGQFELSEEAYISILNMKTASYIECCCRVGAIVGNASLEEQGYLAAYGRYIGMTFQVIDDLLDFKGDHNLTGKSLATDFREGCTTLPLIYLRPRMTKEETCFVKELFGNGASEGDICRITEWMDQRGAYAAVWDHASSYAHKASGFLEHLPASPYRELMMQSCDSMLTREM